jgi:hypothetical protein
MKINSNRCKGNALVETTVLMVVMLPLIFALAFVGDLVDLNQTMEQAARYSSWESTVAAQADSSSSTAAVQERFFTASDQAIASELQSSSVNALWGRSDSAMGDMQSESAVVLDPASISVALNENVTQPTLAMKIGQAAARSGEILDGIRGNSWGLSASGPSSVTVEAKIGASAWLPSSDSECSESGTYVCLNSRAVILDDSWSASGDSQAAQRVRSLMPASVLEPIGNAVSVVGNLPLFQELKDLRGAFGHVDMTVLPEYTDR